MKIRKAEKKDIPRILTLLGQVLQIHAEIRPDIFISGTTKYTSCELEEPLKQQAKELGCYEVTYQGNVFLPKRRVHHSA